MKKKLLSILLASAMILGLTACGSKEPTTTPSEATPSESATTATDSSTASKTPAESSVACDVTPVPESAASSDGTATSISFAWWGSEPRYERMQKVLGLYSEQNPGISFEVNSLEWNNYWTQLAALSADNALPDCLQMDYAYLEQYVNDGLLTDLTPYVESGLLDVSDVDPGILESGSVDGRLYAVCAGVNAPALLYNRTLLDELSITINDNMTLDDFMNICREVYKQTGIKTALPYGTSDSFLPFLLRAQGINQPFNDDSLNIPDAKALLPGFRIYETGIEEGWLIGAEVYAELTSNTVEQSPMIFYTSTDSQSWCAFHWSNQLEVMANAAPDGMEIGITTWPSNNIKLSNYLKPSQFFCVSKDAAENEEETVKLINYLLNSVEANEILLDDRGVSPSSKVATAISPLLNENSRIVTAYINNVVTPNCSPINPPIPDGANEVYDYYYQLIDQILLGISTSEEAAVRLFEQGNEIMAK